MTGKRDIRLNSSLGPGLRVSRQVGDQMLPTGLGFVGWDVIADEKC